MIFTPEEIRAIRQQRMHATLVPISQKLKIKALRPLRRITTLDNGDVLRAVVQDQTKDGDSRPAMLTVLGVTTININDLHLDDARACGFRTTESLRDTWLTKHPKSPEAQLVHFVLGDHRDRDRFIGWTGRAGGDYTMSRSRSSDQEAAALSRQQLDELAAANGQKDIRRAAELSARLARESDVTRLARLESVSDRERAAIRRELRVITDRLDRGRV